MLLFSKGSVLLFIAIIVKKISTEGISIFKYKLLTTLNDKISTNHDVVFLSRNSSRLQCVSQCTLLTNCASVFYSSLLCKGFSVVYSPLSVSLVPMPGTRYYISDDYTTPTQLTQTAEVTTTVNVELESCNSLNGLGYVWDVAYGICYRLHTVELDGADATAKCPTEHVNSHLFLIHSDDTYNFAKNIIDTYNTGAIYVQGRRSGSNFVDDNGQVMTYFRWASGEPSSSGDYLRTDTDTRLQETSSGSVSYKFICRLY
ncbi:uncharacterized protein LOC130047123 [Ostrea edulis]|uniref:uncharacterized protein LOC130047123 n=1 Tax=Ostrea edulis TaxID=37623 RepID=UPI0024AF8A53|nr:uncharacterized protein LOC130047123 [Ostrea edulis]